MDEKSTNEVNKIKSELSSVELNDASSITSSTLAISTTNLNENENQFAKNTDGMDLKKNLKSESSNSTKLMLESDSNVDLSMTHEQHLHHSNLSGSSSANSSQLMQNTNNSAPLNEKVASLASSVYTELEKIVKLYGRDTVKDLMSILVNILEALDTAYQEKEEQVVENELLRDDYEKLLSQYEREKQARKDTELKLFQSEDSFAEQKRDYEEKVKSLESIVRMIDLKSKNTSDHVIRLEEKENELKREYAKLHERYTELFKTHCDYMERTKILFGNDRFDNSGLINQSNNSRVRLSNMLKTNENSKQLLEILRSSSMNINRNDLINALKSSTRGEINMAISHLLSQDLNSADSNTISASSTSSLASLSSQQKQQNQNQQSVLGAESLDSTTISEKSLNDASVNTGLLNEDNSENGVDGNSSKLNLQSSDNFDEHISSNCVEFDDTASDIQSNHKNHNDLDTEYEGEEENSTKNDLSLFNELSRENYDITELDDGADLTGMTREVANLIRENSELLQTKHALNVLKDDLIVRLDQFSSEMVILREEIKSLQTVKACLQLRITELEEEAKKTKEDMALKAKKQEEEDENTPMSQRKRFTRAEMARVLMERNQYKERLMDLQEAVRWTEMMRASKLDPAATTTTTQPIVTSVNDSSDQHHEQKKKTPLWKFFSDLFGTSNSAPSSGSSNSPSVNYTTSNNPNRLTTSTSNSNDLTSSPNKKNNFQTNPSKNLNTLPHSFEQVVPHNESSLSSNSNNDAYLAEKNQLAQNLSDKAAKAYEFLKEESQSKTIQLKQTDKSSLVVKEDGRMQAYGWSLPSKSSYALVNESKTSNLSVPVPVYCRPLFEQDNNLKLSCSSSVTFAFDPNIAKDCAELIKSSSFNYFQSTDSTNDITLFKSSCIWVCNFNSNDTHVAILDANRPADIIEQFTLKYMKIHCIQSITGAFQHEFPLNEEKLKKLASLKENENILAVDESANQESVEDTLENITYIECDQDQETLTNSLNNDQTEDTSNGEAKTLKDKEKILTSIYPTMWLGSQEGWLLVHSSISNVSKTIDKVKLKDAVLCISQNGGRVIVGLADGTVAIFNRNSEGLWDLKNYYLINFGKPHHSIRCLNNVYENVWCGCRNKIYILNPEDFKVMSSFEVHPRKENQVRHIVWSDEGVWVSIRLDSTLRLYHAKTLQHLQYLDIEPFITRMLGTSNLGLSLIRISSLVVGSKRLWIGTGNGVILSIPINEGIKENTPGNIKTTPGSVVRVNSNENGSQSNPLIPYCNLSEAQFSFHGHRDAIKFFLSVPSQTIKKLNNKQNKLNEDNQKPKTQQDVSYENVETILILSGGHGYIDFRIGDTKNSSTSEASNEQRFNDIKTENVEKTTLNKNDRSHLIAWQVYSNN